MTVQDPFLDFVESIASTLVAGSELPLGEPETGHGSSAAATHHEKTVLVFSPHPDDECVTGALPLRIRRETGARVVNVAVTQGSNRRRRQPRLEELRHACRVLDFDLIQAKQPDGLEQVNLRCQAEDVSLWQESVAAISAILRELRPDLIFLPHRTDANSTHIGTHYLVMDALAEVGTDLSCRVVETEFWAPNPTPNLMVESSTADLATLLRALVCHVGEVERNPYHLRLPAWMQDNVRRGGELVGAQGGAPPDFAFATLYRVRDWTGSEFREVRPEPRFLGSSDSVASVFP